MTISHLRFGPKPIHAPYNVRAADYMAIHKQSYVQQYAAWVAQPFAFHSQPVPQLESGQELFFC